MLASIYKHKCKLYPLDKGIKSKKNNRSTYAVIDTVVINNEEYQVKMCKFCKILHFFSIDGIVTKDKTLTLIKLEYEIKILDSHIPRKVFCNECDVTVKPTYIRVDESREGLIYKICPNCNHLFNFEANKNLIDVSKLLLIKEFSESCQNE
jgi:RNase P subunit RPR2